ncbi:MAG: hypothetical protein OEV55_08150 [candidate division Zixibacteria bacterium]|nr:hypothetical protein [candidate division Zixibacteria bacterium]
MFKSALKYSIVCMILLLLFFSLTCKRPVSPTYTDVNALHDYIKARPDIFSADVYDTSSDDPNFYREITRRENWITVNIREPDDSIHYFRYANVTWDDSIQGSFHTFISGKEYTKEFKAFSRVKAYFEQWGNSGDIYKGWLLMKVSNGEIYSLPKPAGGFGQVNVTFSGSSKSIAVDQLINVDSVLKFDKSAEVSFGILVSDTSDYYFLHIFEEGAWREIPFHQVSGKEYEAFWTTSSSSQDLNVYKHAYIDFLDNESVADTTVKYSSKAWAVLYKIRSQ